MAIMCGGTTTGVPILTRAGNTVLNASYHAGSGTNRMTRPGNFCFRAYRDTGSIASNSVPIHNNIIHQTGTGYSATTGYYTAPVTGYYYFEASLLLNNTTAGDYRLQLLVNGAANRASHIMYKNTAAQYYTIMSAGVYYLPAGQSCCSYYITTASGTPAALVDMARSWFCGHFIG